MFNRTALVGLWQAVGWSSPPTFLTWFYANQAHYLPINPHHGYLAAVKKRLAKANRDTKKKWRAAEQSAHKFAAFYVRKPRQWVRDRAGSALSASEQRVANWQRWINQLAHLRRQLRQYVGHRQIPILVIEGVTPPTVTGKPARRAQNGKPYRPSTLTLLVGVRWLQTNYQQLFRTRAHRP